MSDGSFQFDPANLPDISHLHEGDRNRILKGQFDDRERDLLSRGLNPWTKSANPTPLERPVSSTADPAKPIAPERLSISAEDTLRKAQNIRLQVGDDLGGTMQDSAPGESTRQKSWIHRIPVWREFGHWLKWASACFAFALSMVQINEYGLALVGLLACGVCCITQIHVWTSPPKRFPRLTKALLVVLSVLSMGIAAFDVWKIKGEKKWSNLLPDQLNQAPQQTGEIVDKRQRRLTEEQKKQLIAILASHKDGRRSVHIRVRMIDQEARQFAGDFTDVFKAAGWISGIEWAEVEAEVPSGLTIAELRNELSPPHSDVLADACRRIGLKVSLMKVGDISLRDDAIALIVGPNIE